MTSEYIALFEEYDKNWSWFKENYEELVKKYDGEFVAIYKQKNHRPRQRTKKPNGKNRQKISKRICPSRIRKQPKINTNNIKIFKYSKEF